MTLMALSKAGYGSLTELNQLSATEVLDLVEYENIVADVQYYQSQNQ